MKKAFNVLLIMYLIAFFVVASGFAATKNVADYGDGTCTKANFELAYAAASANDTILFPASGACTWTLGTTIGKAIIVTGNGTTLTTSSAMTNGFFNITGFTTTSNIRITGFTFQMTNQTPVAGIKVDTMVADNIRINNNTFRNGQNGVSFANPKGLIDNNYFYDNGYGVFYTAGSRTNSDAAWVTMTAGTVDATFIENNHFIRTLATNEMIGSNDGGKLVVRYNDFDSTGTAEPIIPIELHGSALDYWQKDNSARRGHSIVEIYNNSASGQRVDIFAKLRSGSNLVYNNTIAPTLYQPRIILYEEEYESSTVWSPLRKVWPAEDQIHNSFFWNNLYNGTAMELTDSNFASYPDADSCTSNETPSGCCTGNKTGCGQAIIQKDRDYFLHAPAATGGKESFTGANGASGSAPTDGVTYATVGTMTFSALGANAYYPYTRYTCPHDLVGTGTCDSAKAGAGIAGGYDTSDVTVPTLTSSTINAAGTSLTLLFSEAVNATINTGWTITPSGGAATLAYTSGTGTNSLVYAINRAIEHVNIETATDAYVNPTPGITDLSGNPLADIVTAAVTNNSTVDTGHPTLTAFTIPATASSLAVAVSSFTCTDVVAVTNYCIVLADSSAGCSWAGAAPSTIIFAAGGAQTAYAFCRDAAGNVSETVSHSASCTITLSGSGNISVGSGSATMSGIGTGSATVTIAR